MQRSRSKMLFVAAIAAVSLVAVPASGQIRANQDGHAVDANNRVGSGGFNDTVGGGGVNQANIIYGNVTGLSGFSGPLPDFAPGQFEGPAPNQLFDNFVRTTAGSPTPYQSPSVANATQAFYGSSRNLVAPIGTERLGATGAYIGTNVAPAPNADPLLAQVTAALDQQKQSLGESAVLGSGTNLIQQNSFNGDQSLGGALDANNQATLYTLSPLYGVNPLPGSDAASEQSGNSLFGPPSLAPGGAGRLRAQDSDVARMRAELLQQQNPQQNDQSNDQQSRNPNQRPAPGDANLLGGPQDASVNPAQKIGGNNLVGDASLSNSVNTQQGIQQRITGVVPGRQPSASVKAYNARLNQYKSPQLRQLEAYAKMANDRAAVQAKSAPGGMPTSQPAGGQGIGTPGARGPAGLSIPLSVPNLSPPPTVESLAKDVQAKGLHDLLQSAEDLMKQDKFQSAIARYNTAEDVAPNDALIPLGRANAELGAGYYNQASVDLHQVFESSPATLLGRYDLTKWMNEKRLDFIASDLLALSKVDKTQEMPEFLLAYLLYNSGRQAEALEHLQKAKERAGGKDSLLAELEARWKSPETGGSGKPSSNLNK